MARLRILLAHRAWTSRISRRNVVAKHVGARSTPGRAPGGCRLWAAPPDSQNCQHPDASNTVYPHVAQTSPRPFVKVCTSTWSVSPTGILE